MPPFLSSVAPLSARLLTGGFASQPRDWFAFLGKEPSMPQKECNAYARRSSERDFCTIGYNSTIFDTLHRYIAAEYAGGGLVVKNPVTQVTIDVCSTTPPSRLSPLDIVADQRYLAYRGGQL